MFPGKHLMKIQRLKNTARIHLWIPGFFLLLLTGCRHDYHYRVSPAFYYWKTNFRMGSFEQDMLRQTQSSTLYIRLFDVDWDQQQAQPLPVGIINTEAVRDSTLTCIPAVFITQRCLYRLKEEDLPGLASSITGLMGTLCRSLCINPPEIQIDCDWTRQTADRYFKLLQLIKAQAFAHDKKMSCTIRMHQVKYTASSGIPPVDRGMLMIYNMGNLKKYGPDNSILDLKDAKDYMKDIKQYPIPLDVALPLYRWAVLFTRGNFAGIANNVSEEDFKPEELARTKTGLYRVQKTTRAGYYDFKAGTEIRFEHPATPVLADIAGYIAPRMNDTAFRVAFFHLDSASLGHFNSKDITTLISRFE